MDGAVVRDRLAERPYNAVPLAELAPHFTEGLNLGNGVVRRERSLHFVSDRQDETPDVRLGLSRVGVSRVRRIVRLEIDGEPRVYNGEFAMVADLAPDKAGVHMSRFTEILEEATLDVLARDDVPPRIERLVEAIAREIVGSQRAIRADVRLRADFGLERWTPVSGKRGEEIYTLIGIAHADAGGTRCVVGVEAEGMTACPCAQQMVRNTRSTSCCRPASPRPMRTGRWTRCRARRTTNRPGRLADRNRCRARPGRSGRRSRRDRRERDVERDVRFAQTSRRVLRREQGAPQSQVRRGRRARDPRRARSRCTPISATTRSRSPAK